MKDDIIDIINNEDSLDRDRLDEKYGTDTANLSFYEFKRILQHRPDLVLKTTRRNKG